MFPLVSVEVAMCENSAIQCDSSKATCNESSTGPYCLCKFPYHGPTCKGI